MVCVEAGAPGITVHPRADERHIRPGDVDNIAAVLEPVRDRVEYNIEGNPRPDLIEMVERVRPDQCTLVPVRPGELTSEAGWPANTPRAELAEIMERFRGLGVRVSVFVDPEPAPIDWAAELGADRVELYTEPYARAFEQGGEVLQAALDRYRAAAERAARNWAWRQRRPRPRFGKPPDFPELASHRRSLDRACIDGARAVRWLGVRSCGIPANYRVALTEGPSSLECGRYGQ